MKYIVICVVNRDIDILGVKDTLSEAQQTMLDDFLEVLYSYGYSQDDFRAHNESKYWEFYERDACITGNDDDYEYNWSIFEIEV